MRKSALFWFGLVVATLVALGLVVLFSASTPNSIRLNHGDAWFFFRRQLIYVGVGLVGAAVVASVDYHVLRRHPLLVWLMYGTVFLLLLAVFPPLGRRVNGAFRWINLGPVNLQPSELAKLAIVVVLARWMDKLNWNVETFWKGAFVPFLLIGAYALPILCETDLGSTMVVGGAGVLVMFVAGTRLSHLIGLGACGAATFLAFMVTNANRMRRLSAWLPPKIASLLGYDAAASGSGEMSSAAYQSWNSLVAIRRGGIGGVGLTQSMQKQYYLPEAHTDFIFAVGAEELGIGFSIAVIVLFALFLAFAVYIANKASDRFGRLLVIGMTFIIFFQAMFNLGVVCEALPTKGMALPFFSYGGTNMVSALVAVGTILSVGIHSYRDTKRTVRSNALG